MERLKEHYISMGDEGPCKACMTLMADVSTPTAVGSKPPDSSCGDFVEEDADRALSVDKSLLCTCGLQEALPERAPRIFFGTRTHKQISQVIRELRKTKYAKTSMCILSSRAHTCINPDIRRQSNINDACANLTRIGTCPYDQPRRRSDLNKCIEDLHRSGSWDLGEYVERLSKVPVCPYFQAWKLVEMATIVFCPYNYLLDTVVRGKVASDLEGSIIIIDEAHNLEDAAREAASCTLLEKDILTATEDLHKFINLRPSEKENTQPLLNLLASLHRVMEITRSRLVSVGDSANSSHVWTGSELEGLLQTVGLGEDKFRSIRACYQRLVSKIPTSNSPNQNQNSLNPYLETPTSGTIRLFEYIFTLLGFLYGEKSHHMANYRAVLTEIVDYERTRGADDDVDATANRSPARWLSKVTRSGSKSRLVESRTLSLNFWCLNPAVCMSSLAACAHSLILASGTLAPLDALAAELGLEFPVRLEANHVVSADRVFAASIARGPGGNRLCANYSNQNSFAFQDDIGSLILEACRLVPGGVLCFFPSYGLLDKLVQRWELTGLLDRLAKVKYILQEPRTSSDFSAWMSEFYEAIDATRSSTEHSRDSLSDLGLPSQTGAVALAVYRGKVSEGLDFADDYARLIVSVEQKRIFNDAQRAGALTTASNVTPAPKVTATAEMSTSGEHETTPLTSKVRRVLSGSEWYEAQAYRALNQALGRCIRHRNDWGAIILADCRFAEQPTRYLSGVSRWLRNQVIAHHTWPDLGKSLSQFIQRVRFFTGEEPNTRTSLGNESCIGLP
ncbi:Fanconi anemia group J protein [Sparganum proliferum]